MFTLFDHQEIQDRYLQHAIAKEIAKRKAKLSELEAELARRKTELARREAELASREAELDKRVVMAVLEQTKLIVKRLLAKGLMSHEDIAECAGLPLSEVESLAKKTRKRTK